MKFPHIPYFIQIKSQQFDDNDGIDKLFGDIFILKFIKLF